MKKIFVIMGKSSSGKDTIFRQLLNFKDELNIVPYIPYTTRPIRKGEKNKVDYFFTSNEEFDTLIANGKMLEYREYNTEHGVWKYGTVMDSQLDTDKNILIVLTLEAYISLISSNIIDKENIIPIYVEVEDGKRLSRALAREKKQTIPKYQEMCRRFLADSKDFSEENLKKANITIRFKNNNFETCLTKIKNYILSFNKYV